MRFSSHQLLVAETLPTTYRTTNFLLFHAGRAQILFWHLPWLHKTWSTLMDPRQTCAPVSLRVIGLGVSDLDMCTSLPGKILAYEEALFLSLVAALSAYSAQSCGSHLEIMRRNRLGKCQGWQHKKMKRNEPLNEPIWKKPPLNFSQSEIMGSLILK